MVGCGTGVGEGIGIPNVLPHRSIVTFPRLATPLH